MAEMESPPNAAKGASMDASAVSRLRVDIRTFRSIACASSGCSVAEVYSLKVSRRYINLTTPIWRSGLRSVFPVIVVGISVDPK